MRTALVGVAILLLIAAPRLWVVSVLRREGQSTRTPSRRAFRGIHLHPFAWLGVCAIVGSVNAVAGGLLLIAVGVACAVALVVGLTRGARRLPAAVRLMGDPDAWRGRADRQPERPGRIRHDHEV